MKRTLVILSLILFFAAGSSHAQTDTVRIKTSSVCNSCKKRIEHDLSFEKGVESAVLDVDTKIVTAVYDPAKTNPDKIRKRIAKIGYDADDVKKDPKGFKKLPECCQEPGHVH